jgi:hypothetical protein
MASTIDAAGQIKLATLDEALIAAQRLHGIVEHMAVAVKTQQNAGPYVQQLKRAATPLVGLLKPQFSLLSDQVTQIVLVATRSGSEQLKVRALRGAVAQFRMQLEVSMTRVKDQHTVKQQQPSGE